jgi:hypothetical protein
MPPTFSRHLFGSIRPSAISVSWLRTGRICLLTVLASLTAALCACVSKDHGIAVSGAMASAICADYLSHGACAGGRYHAVVGGEHVREHRGIDIRAAIGTEVISASHGVVAQVVANHECGGGVWVATDIFEPQPSGQLPVQLYASYWHIVVDPHVSRGDRLKPGDRLGVVADPRDAPNQRCVAPRSPHLHFEINRRGEGAEHVNPHRFWRDGIGRISCLSGSSQVPSDKLVFPIRC